MPTVRCILQLAGIRTQPVHDDDNVVRRLFSFC